MSQNHISVPAWAKKAIWYQIFPERFCNGDPSNDPTIEDIRGAYPHDITSPWQIHPWTADWYELQLGERRFLSQLEKNFIDKHDGFHYSMM